MTTETATTMEAPVVGGDNEYTPTTEPTTQPTNEAVDFATDENVLPTEAKTSEYQWVHDKFKDAEGKTDSNKLAESYASLTKKLSDKGMAAPESAEGYEINLGDESEVNDEAMAEAREFFKGLDLPAQYAQPLMEKLNESLLAAKEHYSANAQPQFDPKETATTLQETWGKDFKANLANANRAIKQYYDGDITEHLELANNPVFAQIMAKIGSELNEDTAPSPTPRQPPVTDDDIAAIIARPDYYEKMNDRTSDVYKKMQAWQAMNGGL